MSCTPKKKFVEEVKVVEAVILFYSEVMVVVAKKVETRCRQLP